MKSLEMLGAVTHTHARVFLNDEITINSNSFSMSLNKRNLNYEQKI